MNYSLLLLQFLPLVTYLAVEAWKGFKSAIYAAIFMTMAVVAYTYLRYGELDQFMIGEGILILVLGLVSLRMNNDRYFKFQPTVLAAIFSVLFAWFQVFDKPLMLHFIPHMQKLVEEPDLGARAQNEDSSSNTIGAEFLLTLESPQFKVLLERLSLQMIWIFLVHSFVMGYAALRCSTKTWVAWRLAIYPAMMLTVVINQLFN